MLLLIKPPRHSKYKQSTLVDATNRELGKMKWFWNNNRKQKLTDQNKDCRLKQRLQTKTKTILKRL